MGLAKKQRLKKRCRFLDFRSKIRSPGQKKQISFVDISSKDSAQGGKSGQKLSGIDSEIQYVKAT